MSSRPRRPTWGHEGVPREGHRGRVRSGDAVRDRGRVGLQHPAVVAVPGGGDPAGARAGVPRAERNRRQADRHQAGDARHASAAAAGCVLEWRQVSEYVVRCGVTCEKSRFIT